MDKLRLGVWWDNSSRLCWVKAHVSQHLGQAGRQKQDHRSSCLPSRLTMLDASVCRGRRCVPRSVFRAQVNQGGDQYQDRKTPWIHVSNPNSVMRIKTILAIVKLGEMPMDPAFRKTIHQIGQADDNGRESVVIVSAMMNFRKIHRRSKIAGDCVYTDTRHNTEYTMNGSMETVDRPRRTVFTRHDSWRGKQRYG